MLGHLIIGNELDTRSLTNAKGIIKSIMDFEILMFGIKCFLNDRNRYVSEVSSKTSALSSIHQQLC